MVEMTGNFIFNYLHDDDKKVFADALGFELIPPSSPTTSLSADMITAANSDPDLFDLPRKFPWARVRRLARLFPVPHRGRREASTSDMWR